MKWFLFSDPERRVYNAKNPFRRPSWTAEHTSGGTRSSSDKSSQTSERSFGSLEADQSKCASQQTKDLQIFTYGELEAATRKFARGNLLGEGGFGSVFKGCIRKLHNGEGKLEVAVKQLNQKSLQGDKEWLAEIYFLSYVDHPNLVKLVGYCSEDNEKGMHRLLVYELVPNRSLDEHLFGRSQFVLSWKLRVQIALGAARGLAYLHEGMDVQVIFRDFKTSNVLLDSDFNPKLSDFGFARQGPALDSSHVTTAVLGTVGYAAPEYVQTGHLTSKSDVWSFGVVLLELLTGRKAIDDNRPKHEQRLLQWIKPLMMDFSQFPKMLDPKLEGVYPLKAAQKVATLAFQCLQIDPYSRPKMSVVVERLSQALESSELPYFQEKTIHSRNAKFSQETAHPAKAKRWSLERIVKLFDMENGCLGCRKL